MRTTVANLNRNIKINGYLNNDDNIKGGVFII